MKKVYLVATLVAILTGIAVYLFATNMNKTSNVVNEELFPAVTAKADIPENTVLTADMVTVAYLPKAAVTAVTVKDPATVVGKTTSGAVCAGEQIASSRLLEVGNVDSGELVTRITPGMRAYTVSVNEITGVAGNLRKGCRIDIMLTKVEQDISVTSVLFQYVKVLSVGSGTGAESSAYSSITVELSPSDCIKLYHAMNTGAINIVLRGTYDDETSRVPSAEG